MMFSKIDKKILIWIVIALVVILLLGLAIYRYMKEGGIKVQDTAGGIGTEIENNTPQVQVQPEDIQAQGANGGGTLTVCVDKCGDGICQTSDPECKDSMNCVCPENQQECPQDCK